MTQLRNKTNSGNLRKLKFEQANTEFILQQQSQEESMDRNNLKYPRLNERLSKTCTQHWAEQKLNYLERIDLNSYY